MRTAGRDKGGERTVLSCLWTSRNCGGLTWLFFSPRQAAPEGAPTPRARLPPPQAQKIPEYLNPRVQMDRERCGRVTKRSENEPQGWGVIIIQHDSGPWEGGRDTAASDRLVPGNPRKGLPLCEALSSL